MKRKTTKKSQLEKNIIALSKEARLDSIEQNILGIAIRLKQDKLFCDLCETLYKTQKISFTNLISSLLDIPLHKITARLTRTTPLLTTGLIKMDVCHYSRTDFDDLLDLPQKILTAFLPPNKGIEDMKSVFFGCVCTAKLSWDDFVHIKEDRDFITDLVKGAVNHNVKGVNILLYGAPGTGKTELCQTIAGHLSFNMYSIGETDDDGDEPTTKERISALRLTDHILGQQNDAVLLFDEMEGVLSSFGNGGRKIGVSKVYANRLIENNSVPTFWTCNDITHFDTAFLRRMTTVVELKSPPQNVRERIWNKMLSHYHLSMSATDVTELARMYEGPPSLIANAVKSIKLAGGGKERAISSIRKMVRVTGNEKLLKLHASKESAFLPSLLNTDQDLTALTHKIVTNDIKGFSFCLYGAPGTGKSAYVRHLAKEMKMKVLHKRTSDLVSKWVGESEQNIAAAFQEAQDKGTFLIFDEADSLLRDRSRAERSWEASQVNEMLTWMNPILCPSPAQLI